MIAISLQSGSNGNCLFVEACGVRLLFDAGISGVQAERRLAAFGQDIRRVDALILSHDHRDHTRCAGVYQRKYGLPIHASEPTLRAADRYCGLGALSDVRHFRPGERLAFGEVAVETFRTPHDGVDGAAFIVEARGRRLGVMTDLGHVFEELRAAVRSVHGLLVESNYDPHMLQFGPYPAFLKSRIRGDGGHLSNEESAALLAEEGRELQWVCVGHLSEDNNRPELAHEAHHAALGGRVPVSVAGRYEPTGGLEL